jgi:hypothetical protein
MIIDKLDQEFKMFMRWRGINIDGQLFDLTFEPPQNFASYRQADIDSARIATFTQLEQIPYLSKRFLMKRYLGLSEMEMSENEIAWNEERGNVDEAPADPVNLRSMGISPGGIESDLGEVTPEEPGEGGVDASGMPAAAPAPEVGAAPAAPV